MFRLSTVRQKLTMLVALSAIATLASLAVLSWVMNRQLIDEVDDRIPEAVRGFDLELTDDLRDLDAMVHTLADSAELEGALRGHDKAAAEAEGKPFHDAYSEIDFVVYDGSGNLLTSIGVAAPAPSTAGLPKELLASATAENDFRGVTPHGCETSNDAPAAYVLARRVREAGLVVACAPLDMNYLKNAGEKLGVELALLTPDGRHVTMNGFPDLRFSELGSGPLIADLGNRMWAFERFEPKALAASAAFPGATYVVAALDVTDIRSIVRSNIVFAAIVLSLAAAITVALGARLATIMSKALGRVNAALKKLEQEEYVHVEAVRTGDELEDLASGFNTMVDGLRERDKLRTTFGKYMTQTVMEHLLSGKVELGGKTLKVTVLFSDIRSFTTISESMDAQALVGLLNEYFTEMVSIVMQEDGVVDKYIGDAIMAVFGAPVPKPDDAVRAVRAAVRMRQALADLNVRLVSRGIAPLRTGIGIHTGEVVAGNIGSEARMEYTVIGDAVNLASRLEGSTKDLGKDVLISDETYALVKDTCDARPVKEITVKGRVRPVMTYEVLALVGDAAAVHSSRPSARASARKSGGPPPAA